MNLFNWWFYTFTPKFLYVFFPGKKIRPMIDFIHKNNLHDDMIGAEIGVDRGYNSESILVNLPMKMLYLIDPYSLFYVQDDKVGFHSESKEIAHKKLKPFKDRICFIEQYSHIAVDSIPDDYLDFVYIDGNHSYSFVKRDIDLYFPKVKNGGVIGGHDFFGECHGLCKAVLEFVEQNGFSLNAKDIDWWIVKGEKK